MRAGLKQRPVAPPPVAFRLAPQGWDCRVRTVSNLRDPLDGPCVIPVYTQAGLDEVRSWATASPPVHPVTCVDFISPAPSQKVLVLVPRAPGPTVRLATLHSLSAQCPGPKPLSIAVSPELDDKALNADAKAPEWANFRLTLAREFCDAERFAAGKARPQALPALLLPKVTVGLIIRTFAVAVYDTELTCLFRVRKADAAAVLESARALPSGAFLSPQRSQSHTVTWLQRASGQSASAYLASATEALGKATEHCCLAYRPGGRSNLGIRGSLEATKAVAHNGVGTIAPRHRSPEILVHSEASTWLAEHGFPNPTAVERASSTAWRFRAWSSHPAGPIAFSSGIAVSPAQGRAKKRAVATKLGLAVWGAAALPAAAPEPASQPAAAPKDSSATGAPDHTERERSHSPAPKKPEAVQPRPAMPHSALFAVVETAGGGGTVLTRPSQRAWLSSRVLTRNLATSSRVDACKGICVVKLPSGSAATRTCLGVLRRRAVSLPKCPPLGSGPTLLPFLPWPKPSKCSSASFPFRPKPTFGSCGLSGTTSLLAPPKSLRGTTKVRRSCGCSISTITTAGFSPQATTLGSRTLFSPLLLRLMPQPWPPLLWGEGSAVWPPLLAAVWV